MKKIMKQEMCPYCDIPREVEKDEKNTWTWTCPECGSMMKSNVADFGGRIRNDKS